MRVGFSSKSTRLSNSPKFFSLTLYLMILVLPTIIIAVSGTTTNSNYINKKVLNKLPTHNSTLVPLINNNTNTNINVNININANSFNNRSFAIIQGTKLERESTSSGWQINAGVYLEKSIGDGHSTMWESSSDDDSSDDDGWGWAKGARKSKKKKFSMLSHKQGTDGVVNSTTNGNGSARIQMYRYDGIVDIDQFGSGLLTDGEMTMEMDKFKLKKQHSWSEKGNGEENLDDGDVLKSDASYIWNKLYDLVRLYVFILWIILVG